MYSEYDTISNITEREVVPHNIMKFKYLTINNHKL